MSPDTRAKLYALAATLLGVLGIYGVVTAAQADAWLRLAQAGVEVAGAAVAWLARMHVPDAPDAAGRTPTAGGAGDPPPRRRAAD